MPGHQRAGTRRRKPRPLGRRLPLRGRKRTHPVPHPAARLRRTAALQLHHRLLAALRPVPPRRRTRHRQPAVGDRLCRNPRLRRGADGVDGLRQARPGRRNQRPADQRRGRIFERPRLRPERRERRPAERLRRSARQRRHLKDRRHAAGGDDRQPLLGQRPRRLHRSPARRRISLVGARRRPHLHAAGSRLPRRVQAGGDRSRNPDPQRNRQGRPLPGKALREPRAHPARPLHGDQERPARRDLQDPAEGGARPGDRPTRHHGRKPAAVALQPLPPALPRRRAQPAGHAAQLRRL